MFIESYSFRYSTNFITKPYFGFNQEITLFLLRQLCSSKKQGTEENIVILNTDLVLFDLDSAISYNMQ